MTAVGIKCRVCGHETRDYLGDHLLEKHGVTVDAYLADHPGVATMSQRLLELHKARHPAPRRAHPPKPNDLKVTWAGVEFGVNSSVPPEACFKRPKEYRVPSHGALGTDIQHFTISLRDPDCPPMYIHGPAGCGKDAAFQAWSADTLTPKIFRSIIPGADIESWFFTREFDANGTRWEEGPVLKGLRDGYTCPDGTVVPYLFLITDFDRADRSQAEYLRLITDTVEGRVAGPKGRVFPILEGTRVAATGNSCGSGDPRGRYISSQPLDASILDRFEVAVKFHQLDWNDEGPVVRAKFPFLVERCPGIFPVMGRLTEALRIAISNDELYAEFSHRALCAILKHSQRLLHLCGEGQTPENFISKSLRVWLDKLPDKDTRQTAVNTLDPHVDGGLLDEGDTSHIKAAGSLADWANKA